MQVAEMVRERSIVSVRGLLLVSLDGTSPDQYAKW
jgi:hypothetical protein